MAAAAAPSSAAASASGSSRVTTRECVQPGVLTEPGSPNCGCSSGVPASASSIDADSAPTSIRASQIGSACAASVRKLILRQPISVLDLALGRELLLEIVDAGAAF